MKTIWDLSDIHDNQNLLKILLKCDGMAFACCSLSVTCALFTICIKFVVFFFLSLLCGSSKDNRHCSLYEFIRLFHTPICPSSSQFRNECNLIERRKGMKNKWGKWERECDEKMAKERERIKLQNFPTILLWCWMDERTNEWPNEWKNEKLSIAIEKCIEK